MTAYIRNRSIKQKREATLSVQKKAKTVTIELLPFMPVCIYSIYKGKTPLFYVSMYTSLLSRLVHHPCWFSTQFHTQ